MTDADILRAEAAGEDLQEGPLGLHVCAMKEDGSLYEIGHVTLKMAYQDPSAARMAIDRIKFGKRRKTHD